MSYSRTLPVTKDEILNVASSGFVSSVDNELDFVALFPPELSEKLFTYLRPIDLMKCAQASMSWRKATNSNLNWQRLCLRYGFIDALDENKTGPDKLTNTASHVDKITPFRGKKTPKFVLPPVASTRIEPLCKWGRYFRQCHRLHVNWARGKYIIQKLPTPSETGICTAADFNGHLAIFGSSIGCVFIWYVLGIPKLIHSIPPIRARVEVEKVKLTSDFLVVLYQIGIIRIYQVGLKLQHQKVLDISVTVTAQIRIKGLPVNELEFTLDIHDISDEQFAVIETADAEAGNDLEEWIRELFRDEPWFEAFDYSVSDMSIATTNEHLVASGLSCNCFAVWELKFGRLLGKYRIGNGFHMRYKFMLTEDRIYFTARKVNTETFATRCGIICHSIADSNFLEEIHTHSLVESIQVERGNQRMVWVTTEAVVTLRKVENGEETRIRRVVQSYVDSLTLHGEYIIYHEYDGFIVTLDWDGKELYRTSPHIGIVRGICCYKEFLVSAGDVRQLCVWNVHTGKKLYEIYHQPSRISSLFVDETKIITFGLEDPPVHIGFW